MTHPDRTVPPKIAKTDSFSLPKPRKTVLENGIPLFLFDNPNLDLIYILVQVRTGTLYQQQKHVCQYACMLLRESSRRLLPYEMEEKLDYFGTNMTTNVNNDRVQIMISVPKRNITEILPLITDFFADPFYRDESLQIYKEKEIKNLALNEQRTDYLAWRFMWREMLGGCYPKIFDFATQDSINAVTVDQLSDFQSRSFVAENMELFITGNLDSPTEHAVTSCFSMLGNGNAAPKLPLAAAAAPSTIYHPFKNCLQSSVVLSFLSMGYNNELRPAFSVLNTVVGGYFGSRLMQCLREKHGYTYGVSSSSAFFADQSVFAINTDVNAESTNAAIDACFMELRRLQRELIENEELDTVKDYMSGVLLRSIDNSVNAMQKFAYYRHFGLDDTELYGYMSKIKEVTSDDLIFLAKNYLGENNFTKIIVGRYCE